METSASGVRIGVMTSGGDAQGMNAAVRAVVRTAIHLGATPFAIHEGWQGAVDGGEGIREMAWDDVGSTLNRGGTIIGTARCKDFRERWGMRAAAAHLLEHGIDRLVVIGGDGSLSGTEEFRREWPSLLAELVAEATVTQEVADAHPSLTIAGLVGSIDNDLVGTDSTIGADSALHRIVEAIDALSSTAASHQRSFVVEVMGRHCGYLPLLAAIAGGCDYVFVPEAPPGPNWAQEMCEALRRGRASGRRDSLVIVAEGAQDAEGNHIAAADVMNEIRERLGEDTRLTILGHVQRGGTPSAYDRWMSTVLGYEAVVDVLRAGPEDDAHIVGVRHNRLVRLPLVDAVARTRDVATKVQEKNFGAAVTARGKTFGAMLKMFGNLSTPPSEDAGTDGRRVAVLHAGGLAPGMNPALRAAVRLGIAHGHQMLGIRGGFPGLIEGRVEELNWGDVDPLVAEGGAHLGTRRTIPTVEDLYAVGRALEEHRIEALLVVGGFKAYLGAHLLVSERTRYPAFRIPIVCVPASIDNNLPGAELSIGADSALNSAVDALDQIKQSASASRRTFVAEVMGRRCGYLALMAGIATGAEQVYLHEDGITLEELRHDVERMVNSFREGRQFFLAIRNEQASNLYTTDFLARLFQAEAQGLFDVRTAVLGHIQQGGQPSPFDRVLATRLVAFALRRLTEELEKGGTAAGYVGTSGGEVRLSPLKGMLDEVDLANRRPLEQWWTGMAPVLSAVSDRSLEKT